MGQVLPDVTFAYVAYMSVLCKGPRELICIECSPENISSVGWKKNNIF